MSAHLTLVEPPQSASPADDAAYYREALHALIDVGVRMVRERVEGAEELGEAAEAYDRITRSVRRSIVLAQRLNEPASAPVERKRALARRRIIRTVEDCIEATFAGPHAEALRGELMERVEAVELDDEIDCRPLGEIIFELERDLGLNILMGRPLGKRRRPADIAELCAHAARAPVPERPVAEGPVAEARPPRVTPTAVPGGPVGLGQVRLSEDDALLLHRVMRYREP